MNLLVPQLLAGNLLPGSTEGNSPLFGGQQGSSQGNAGQFGFLTSAAGLANAEQAGAEGLPVVNGSHISNLPLNSEDFADQLSILANLTEDSPAGQNRALQTLLEHNPLLNGEVPNVKGGNNQSDDAIASRDALLLQLFEQKDRLGIAANAQQNTNGAFSGQPLDQLITTPANTEKGVIGSERVSAQSLLAQEGIFAPVPEQAKNTNGAGREGGVPIPPSFTLVNQGEQQEVSATQNTTIPSAGSATQNQPVNHIGLTHQSNVATNVQEELAKNPITTGVINPQNQGVQRQVAAGKTEHPAVQQQNSSSEETEIATKTLGSQVSGLLANRDNKKTDNTPQQKPYTPVSVSQQGGSQNNVTASAPSPATQPTQLHLAKVANPTGLQNTAGGIESVSPNATQGQQTATHASNHSVPVSSTIPTANESAGERGSDKTLAQHSTVDQITIQVSKAVKDSTKQITIHLEPASLGKVDIKMDMAADGKTHISILVDKPETMELLQRDAKQLQNALNDAGIKSDSGSLNFSMRGDQQGKFSEQHGSNPYKQYSQLEQDESLLPEVATYVGSLKHTQGIDIRV